MKTNKVQFGVGQPPHWLRFRVSNTKPHPLPLTVEITNPLLASVRYFLLTETGQEIAHTNSVSWSTPLAERVGQHRNPLFNFTLPAGSPPTPATYWVYIRADGYTKSLQIPVRLWQTAEFLVQDRSNRLHWGWLMGAMGSIGLMSLLLFIMLQEPIYLLYALMVGSAILFLTSTAGFWIEWFDRPNYGILSGQYLHLLFNFSYALLGLLFVRAYVLPPTIHRPVIRLLFTSAIGLLSAAIGLLLVSSSPTDFYAHHLIWAAPLATLLFIIPILSTYGLIIWTGLGAKGLTAQQREPARIHLFALSPLIIQVIASLLRNYNLINDHPLLQLEGTASAFLFEFIILSAGLGYRYRQIRQERQDLREQTYRQQQLATETRLRLQQQETRALEALLRLQQEKERIARDLYDHVGAQLSVIAASSASHGVTRSDAEADLIGTYAREAIQSLRDTVWAIDQSAVTLNDFRVKLQQYINQQQIHHPACRLTLSFASDASVSFTSTQALNLFRQVQEAMHNTFKHAKASHLDISGNIQNKSLVISIIDDGIGFDPAQQPGDQPHYGLRNLQRRAEELHGTCSIETAPGRGTRISVTIPLTV